MATSRDTTEGTEYILRTLQRFGFGVRGTGPRPCGKATPKWK